MLVICHMHLSMVEVCMASVVGVLYQVAVSSVSIAGGGIITGCWLLFVHVMHCQCACCVLAMGDFVGTDIIWSVLQ